MRRSRFAEKWLIWGWLVNKVVTGIYAQVDDPDTVRALDAAITMTIHLRATKRVKELQATGMTLDKITKTLFGQEVN